MLVNEFQLYQRMLFAPKINLNCDGVEVKATYVRNKFGNGWLIKNLNNDKQSEFKKGKLTKEIVSEIFSKYKIIKINPGDIEE